MANHLPEIHPKAKEDLEKIRRICRKILPQDTQPLSIILSGGISRGETGYYQQQGCAVPFGDYDVTFIIPRPLLEREIRNIEENIFSELGFGKVGDLRDYGHGEDSPPPPVLDFRYQTIDEFLRDMPSLHVYDLEQTCRVLEGEDLVSRLPETLPEEISVMEPWSRLGNRILEALCEINTEFWERSPRSWEVMRFRSAVCRTYSDLAGMIAFVHGEYSPFFSERVRFLEETGGLWQSWFPNVEDFVSRVRRAFQFKLQPMYEVWDGSRIFTEWFDLVYDLGRALPHLVNLVLLTKRVPLSLLSSSLKKAGETGRKAGAVREPFREDWRLLVQVQVRAYPSLYFRDLIERTLRRKRKYLPFPRFLAAQASRYYGVMEHLMWKGRRWVLGNLRRSMLSPEAFQAAVLPLFLFSLNPQKEVNLEALDFFDPLMAPYMPMPFDFLSPIKRWEATKRCFVHEMLVYRMG